MFAIPSRIELRTHGIQSSRVRLVPVDVADAREIWDVVDASRSWLQRWLPWVPFQKDPTASLRFAEACASEWDRGRAVRFLIRERPGGRMLGLVGLEQCVEMHRNCDLGYWLRREASGRGVMTEAARLCIDFAFRRVGMHRVRVAAATHNYPSLRVIERLGFVFEGVARQAEWVDGRWVDHAVFALLESDWSAGELRRVEE